MFGRTIAHEMRDRSEVNRIPFAQVGGFFDISWQAWQLAKIWQTTRVCAEREQRVVVAWERFVGRSIWIREHIDRFQ